MIVALVNPNTNPRTTQMMVSIAGRHSSARVSGLTAPYGAPLIATGAALDLAAQAVGVMIPRLTMYDGVVVAAFGDPGQGFLARALPVPVIGIAEAAMAEAQAQAPRFAVVTTTPDLTGRIDLRAAELGYHDGYAGCWVTEGDPAPVMADAGLLVSALRDTARAALDADPGIGAIIIGGGPLAEAAAVLQDDLPVPIVQPIPAAMRKITCMIGKA